MAQGVITEIGRKKLCRAHAGDGSLSAISQMAFGDGGVDKEGNVIETTGAEMAMGKELLRIKIKSHAYTDDKETTCRYTVRLSKTDLVNRAISELALFDGENDMIAYKTFAPKIKDDDMEFIFDMDEKF